MVYTIVYCQKPDIITKGYHLVLCGLDVWVLCNNALKTENVKTALHRDTCIENGHQER